MTEKKLDQALHGALEHDETFRAWFLAQLVHGSGYSKLVLCYSDYRWARLRVILANANTGALEGVARDGETDELAVFENVVGQRLGVHIENKLRSGSFTPYQPEVTAARAEHWVGNEKYGAYESWETVLLAPASFLGRNMVNARKYTSRITHEAVGT